MKGYRYETPESAEAFIWTSKQVDMNLSAMATLPAHSRFAPLRPLRQWLDSWQIQTPQAATLICQLIPARCPFERTVKLFGYTVLRIPPLCKLNPFYEQFVGLRFRALCYLADECHADVSRFC